ncbi:MAG: hypothetical protein ACLTSL_00015 [Odoribacter splanchnicus]
MRTLGKLKLIAVSAALVLGMSSCLKNDKKFAIYASPAYILQENIGYRLQIQVQGNEQIKSASASLNGKSYSFSAVEGSQNFLMQINAYSASIDTISEGLCTVTAFNAEGNSAVSQLQFYSTDKKIGNVMLTKFSYSGADGKVTAEWNKVENAEAYYLLYRIKNSSTMFGDMWLPYVQLSVTDKENPSATTNIPFTKDGEYEIAIGATYRTALRVSDRTLRVTGGKDASIN